MRPYALLTALLLVTGLFAQTPEAFNYQGVARDAGGDALANTAIGVQFQLHQGTAVGSVVYSETHSPTTNDLGLFSLEVGNGTPGAGTFTAIDWSAGPYFLEVGLDPAGGSSYSSVGTQQLLSVPYALHARTADMADDGDWVLSGDTVHSDGRRVGIGTNAPSQDLDVEGTFQLKDGTQGDKKILTSDADGNASWENLSPQGLFGSNLLPTPSLGSDASCLTQIATIATGDRPMALSIVGDHAFVLNGWDDNMMVYDITNPTGTDAPIATISTGSFPNSIAVSENWAFVLNSGDNTMSVFDISDPADGDLPIATIATGNQPNSVAVAGDFAYVTNTLSGDLMIFDITSPDDNDLPIATIATGVQLSSLAISGNYALLVDVNNDNMLVFDITAPTNSDTPIATIATGSAPAFVAAVGNFAYVLNLADNNVEVFDISAPNNGTLPIATLEAGGIPVAITIVDDHAYVINLGSSNLMVFDISAPSDGDLPIATIATGNTPSSVAVLGDHVYVLSEQGDEMIVFERFCEIAEQQQLVYDVNSGEFALAVQPWELDADTVFVNDKKVRISKIGPDNGTERIFQLNDGTQASGRVLTSDAQGNASWQEFNAESFFGAGNLPPAYTGDVSCLAVAATVNTGPSPWRVAVSGGHAYVLDYDNNDMMVFDISSPSSPSLIATIATGNFPWSVAVSSDHAYVVNYGSNNMMVFDISTPASPSLLATIGTAFQPMSVAVSGGYAYVVNFNSNNMMVFDISSPASPSLSATLAMGSGPISVSVSGDHAYVVNTNSNNMMVLDITNPSSPSLSATIATGTRPNYVVVSGDHAYVLNYISSSMMVFDISNPALPSLSATIATGGEPRSLAVSGDHAFVVRNQGSMMMVFDISTPSSPGLSASISTGWGPQSVAVSGAFAYVVNYDTDNMMVFQLFCPEEQQQVTYDPVAASFGSAPQTWQASNDNVYVTDQRVGIGTSVPGAKLHSSIGAPVGTPLLQRTALFLDNQDQSGTLNGPNEVALAFGENGVAKQAIVGGTYGNDHLRFYTGSNFSTSRMAINAAGNVGIGTNTPQSKLDVGGGLAVGASYSGTLPAPANGVIVQGNVGIGTDYPVNRLDVEGGLAVGASYSGSSTAPANGAIVQGSVGIGTTAPEYTLHISNGANTGSGSFGRGLKITDATPRIYFEESDAAVNEKVMFLEKIEDGISFSSVIDNATLFRNQHILFVKGSGSVGIGTAAPTAKLSVNGTANNSTGSWGVFSDARIKTVRREFTDGLSVIDRMRPVVFTYNADAPFEAEGEQVGIIAQELEELAPYMVSTTEHGDIHDLREVNNQAYVFLLINAVKELKAENDRLKTDNVVQREQLEANTRAIEELKALVGAYAGR